MYSLNWNQPGRRTGLTRDGYKAPNLLQSINSSKYRNTMRQKKPQSSVEESMGPVNEVLSEEGIYAPPKDQSDTSDEENASRAADIIPTVFIRRGSEDSNVNSQNSKGVAREIRGKGSSPLPERKAASSIKNTRSSRRLSPGSSSKRKNDENDAQLGTGMVDQFGQVKVKKAKAGKTYGLASHKRHTIRPQQQQSEGSPPAKQFKFPSALSPSYDEESDVNSPVKSDFKKLDSTEFDSPEEGVANTPPSTTFKRLDTTEFDSPMKSIAESPLKSTFRKVDMSGFESSSEESATNFRAPKKFEGQRLPPRKTSEPLTEELPLTQLPTFKKFPVEGDLAAKAQDIIGPRIDLPDLVPTPLDEDDDNFMTQLSRCPMCRRSVDPEELRKCGEMNTRQQEKFCRGHQKQDAEEEWSSRGYPEINWDILDSRISQHYTFIKNLINGADSHYKLLLDQTVKAGKDRTLLKSETNLTPGYYGTRGLRVISENIMREFTPLLKKRAIKDRLMAARGVTGFVQSVLVPELTVLLIMEDMNTAIGEARRVLKESAEIGELVHEEIRDVVLRRAEDSGEDDEECEENYY